MEECSVVIVGAGMSGLLTAIQLQRAGIDSFQILEKGSWLGGTWRDNTYPGLRCDVPSHMFTYSFRSNPEYSSRFAEGSEIQSYLESVAREHDLISKIRFDSPVESCEFRKGGWDVVTKQGEHIRADVVICATGILHHPSYPDIPGREGFGGDSFHTARWDHSKDLSGKRVGIIGSGSTAAQIVPAIVDQVGELKLFQRTPQWIFPMPNKHYSELDKERLRRSPAYASRLRRIYSKVFQWTFARAVIGNPFLLWFIQWQCELHLKRKVKDPELRARLTPDYRAGCKRLIFGKGFYQAIQKSNAALVTEQIEGIEEGGIQTADGKLHELDTIIYATGFQAHNYMRPMKVVGRDGVSIDEFWKGRAISHRSVAIPGFPNFFTVFGPFSPIGNYSAISVAEVQVSYILQMLGWIRKGVCDCVAPSANVTQRLFDRMQKATGKTVWVSGCNSWYLDKTGAPAMWPWTFERYFKEMRRPMEVEFERTTRSEEIAREEMFLKQQSLGLSAEAKVA